MHTDAMATVSDDAELTVRMKVPLSAAATTLSSLLVASGFESCIFNIHELFPPPKPNIDIGREQ